MCFKLRAFTLIGLLFLHCHLFYTSKFHKQRQDSVNEKQKMIDCSGDMTFSVC